MKTCFTVNCMRTEKDFLEYQQILKENKFQALEIFYPYNVSLDQRILYTKNLKKIVELFDIEMVLHLPHGGSNNFINETNEVNNEVKKRMIDAIDYAALFNCKKLTLHLGSAFKNSNRQQLINLVINELRQICDYAKTYGMYIMIENMPGFNEIGYGVLELKYIMENCGCDNIKFILDTGHANVSEDNIIDYIYQLKDYLYHIHFSDNDGSCDQHRRMHLGNIDFEKVFKALADINYQELHCLEIIFTCTEDLLKYLDDINEYNRFYS